MQTIKAIETIYPWPDGPRYRSRLEARWAVFMDAVGIRYQYEHEGFDLGEFGWYLPDFTVIDSRGVPKYWIEIKPHRNLSAREYSVALALSDRLPGYILIGTPEVPRYRGPERNGGIQLQEMYPEGFIPFTPEGIPDPPWQWYQGSWAIEFGQVVNGSRAALGPMGYMMPVMRLSCWHERTDDGDVYLWVVPACEPGLPGTTDPLAAGVKQINSPRLRHAYTKACQARFEHGEHGR